MKPPGSALLRPSPATSPAREYGEVFAAIVAVTIVGWFVPLGYRTFGHVYLLAVIALSLRVGRGPILLAAVVSAIAWNFVFMPPRLSFHVLDFEDALMLGTYFVVALIAGQLTTHIREREKLFAEAELHRTLLDSVSHELKTPLAILRSATAKLLTEDPAKRAALVGEMHTATTRLDHLVANLLNQTRLESGTLKARLDWCEVRDLINAARRTAAPALAEHPCTVQVPDDFPLVRADAPLMEQVFGNLLLNAGIHSTPGGAIRVRAGVEPGSERAYVAVADSGPGLPPEIREHLFQKFRRGRAARAGGLGLGLSIVRGFAVAQGSEVTARGNPEGGTTFTVYLPHASHGVVPSDER